MRRNRIIWLVLFILSLILISYYGGPVAYGFFWLMLLVPVMSWIYLWYVYCFYRIYQKVNVINPIASKATDFYFTLQNESVFTFASIRVQFFSDFSKILGLDENIEYELAPHSGIKKQMSIFCKYRGEYYVGIKRIVITDFLQMFKIEFENKECTKIRVKPNLVHLTNVNGVDVPLTPVAEATGNNNILDVLVRDYIPGDDIRFIHWKATAQLQKLMVRTLKTEKQNVIAILFDTKKQSQEPEKYLPLENKILETVIALTHFFCEKNMSIRVCYKGSEYREELIENIGQFERVYDQLSDLNFLTTNSIEETFLLAAGSGQIFYCRNVILVVPMITPELQDFLNLLNQHGCVTLVCLVDDGDVEAGEIISKNQIVRIPVEGNLQEVFE